MTQLEELKQVFDKPMVTVTEAAEYLRHDPRWLMSPKAKFPYKTRNGRHLISLVALANWMGE